MKTIGLLGGMSPESTAEYYRIINSTTRSKLGGSHSAKILLFSLDFAEIEILQAAGKWNDLTELLTNTAKSIEGAGAEILLICSNTGHKSAPDIENALHIPLLHIVDTTAGAITEQNLKTVGLLGTRFTMEQDFYTDRLRSHGIEPVVPGESDRRLIHTIIYDELCRGVISNHSKHECGRIISELAEAGATGIILGCTELPMLAHTIDVQLPLFDSTEIHASSAAEWAIAADSQE